MDDADKTQERDEILHSAFLAARKPEGPPAIGRCLTCDEPQTEPHRRWCDAECRDLWELENQ